jgi:hypothetical protein
MSIWYQYKIDVLAVDKAATAKFFNLDPKDDVSAYADHFEFSFGGKNMPSMRLGKIVEQNPDLIFLVQESVEVDTVSYWIQRFDKIPNEHQRIFLYTTGMANTKINKGILDLYTKEYPTLPTKHFSSEKGYEEVRWSMFFNDFGQAATLLRRHKEFEEMVNPYKYLNIKTYIVEFEAFGSKGWEGPFPLGKAERVKERLANNAMDITNLSLREVESK